MADLKANTTYGTQTSAAISPAKKYPVLNINPMGSVARYSQTAEDVRQASIKANTAPFAVGQPLLPPQTTATAIQPTQGVDTGNRYQQVPADYGGFKAAATLPYEKTGGLTAPTSPAIRSLPGQPEAGQYNIDTANPGNLIKQPDANGAITRKYNQPNIAKQILGPLPSSLFQIDHIIPLWAGGADVPQNISVIPIGEHETKTKVQAVPLTLLANGKITADQARLMAMNWKNLDATGLPTEGDNGLQPLDLAEQYQKKWNDEMINGKPVSFSDVLKGIPEAAKDFGKGWLPNWLREGVKGLTSGVTAGIVPYTPGDDSNSFDKLVGFGGDILGTIWGLGKFKLAIEPLLALAGWKSFAGVGKVALADLAPTMVRGAETAGAKIAAGAATGAAESIAQNATGSAAKTLVSSLSKLPSTVLKGTKATLGGYMNYLRKNAVSNIARNAAVFIPYGALSEVGQHFVGKQDQDLLANMTQRFTSDVGLSAITGVASPSLFGAAQVGVGVLVLDSALGSSPKDALLNAATMAGLHGLGTLRPNVANPAKLQSAVENEATGVSQNILHWWAPETVPEVTKGQTSEFAGASNLDDAARAATQQKASEWTNAALTKLDSMQHLMSADEYQMYKNQITTTGHYLNQVAMPAAERDMAAVQDLASVTQKAKTTTFTSKGIALPETVPDFIKSVGGEDNLFKGIPREAGIADTPTTGEVRISGTGVDGGVNEQNMVKFAEASKTGNASSNLLIVNRPDTAPLWQHISGTYTPEDIQALKYKPFQNPQNAAQVIGVIRGPNGETQLLPLGWVPRRFAIDERATNFNTQPEIRSGDMPRNNPERNKDSIAARMTSENAPVVTMRVKKVDVGKLTNGRRLNPDSAGAYLIGELSEGDWNYAREHGANAQATTPTTAAVAQGLNLNTTQKVNEALQGPADSEMADMKAQDVLASPLLAGTSRPGQPEVATYLGTVDDIVQSSPSPEAAAVTLEKIGVSKDTATRIASGEPVTAQEIITSVDRKNLVGEDLITKAEELLGANKTVWFKQNAPENRWGSLPVTKKAAAPVQEALPLPETTPQTATEPVAPSETPVAPDALSEMLVTRAKKGDIPVKIPGKDQSDFITTSQGQRLSTTKNPDGTSWLEQNKQKNSEWGKLANEGHTVEHQMRAGGRMGYAGKIRIDGQEMSYEDARKKVAEGAFNKTEAKPETKPSSKPSILETPLINKPTPVEDAGTPAYQSARAELDKIGSNSGHEMDLQGLDAYTDSLIKSIQESGVDETTKKRLATDAMRLIGQSRDELAQKGVDVARSNESWDKQIHGTGFDTIGKYIDSLRGRIADAFDTEVTQPQRASRVNETKEQAIERVTTSVKKDTEPFFKHIEENKSGDPTLFRTAYARTFDELAKNVKAWGGKTGYRENFGLTNLLSDKSSLGRMIWHGNETQMLDDGYGNKVPVRGYTDPIEHKFVPALDETVDTHTLKDVSQPKALAKAMAEGDRKTMSDIMAKRNKQVGGKQTAEPGAPKLLSPQEEEAFEQGLHVVDPNQTENENLKDLTRFESWDFLPAMHEADTGVSTPGAGVETAATQVLSLVKRYNWAREVGLIKGPKASIPNLPGILERVKGDLSSASETTVKRTENVKRAQEEIASLKKQNEGLDEIGGSPRARAAIMEGVKVREDRIKVLEDYLKKVEGSNGQGGPGVNPLSPIMQFPSFNQVTQQSSQTTPATSTQQTTNTAALPGGVAGQSLSDYFKGQTVYKNPSAPETVSPSTPITTTTKTSVTPNVQAGLKTLQDSQSNMQSAHTGVVNSLAKFGQNALKTATNAVGNAVDTVVGNKPTVYHSNGKNPDAVIGGYDTSAYAEDPLHAQKIRSIIATMPPAFSGIADVGLYIKSKAPDSPITGDMIVSAAKKWSVPVSLILATIQQDSSFGTAGLGAKTQNPGNVGTYGDKKRIYPSWNTGVDAVAQWLAEHNTNGVAAVTSALPFTEKRVN